MKDGKNFFDSLPVALQHALLVLLAVLVSEGANYVPYLDVPSYLTPIVGAVVTFAVAWSTTITRQYGVGQPGELPSTSEADAVGKDH